MFVAAVGLGGVVTAPVAAQIDPDTQNGFYDTWLTIAANEALVFTGISTAPTTTMYRAACQPF